MLQRGTYWAFAIRISPQNHYEFTRKFIDDAVLLPPGRRGEGRTWLSSQICAAVNICLQKAGHDCRICRWPYLLCFGSDCVCAKKMPTSEWMRPYKTKTIIMTDRQDRLRRTQGYNKGLLTASASSVCFSIHVALH